MDTTSPAPSTDSPTPPHREPPPAKETYTKALESEFVRNTILPRISSTYTGYALSGEPIPSKAAFLTKFQTDHGFTVSASTFDRWLKVLGLEFENVCVIRGIEACMAAQPSPQPEPQPMTIRVRHEVRDDENVGFDNLTPRESLGMPSGLGAAFNGQNVF